MNKKIKTMWLDAELAEWFDNHAKHFLGVGLSFNKIALKVLMDYAKEHGYKPKEENTHN